jgi:hypothetical protein
MRHYIGCGCHMSASRYTLIQAFSKFGTIAKLDFLFHKSGPLRGKPRGYAFVEFSNPAVSLYLLSISWSGAHPRVLPLALAPSHASYQPPQIPDIVDRAIREQPGPGACRPTLLLTPTSSCLTTTRRMPHEQWRR